jgi:hypothetical protein
MNSKKQITWILLIGIILCSSCKVYQPIDLISPKVEKGERTLGFEMRQLERLVVGDSLKIERSSKDDTFLIFQSISNDSINGLVWKKGTKKLSEPFNSGIPINDVDAIHVRKYDSQATLLLVFVGIPVAAIAGFFIVFAIGGGLDLGF